MSGLYFFHANMLSVAKSVLFALVTYCNIHCVTNDPIRVDHYANGATGIDVILHHKIKSLLGSGDMQRVPRQNLLYNPKKLEPAPGYLMELYKQFKYGGERRGHHRGNTVTAIVAEIALVNSEKMFVFNLTSIQKAKRIYGAEMHLFKRKRRNRTKFLDANMYLNEITPSYLTRVKTIRLNPETYGWEQYDVTNSVMSCVTSDKHRPHSLAAHFVSTKGNGRRGPMRLKRFLKYDSMPYLVVFADEPQNISLDHLDKRYKPHTNTKPASRYENEVLRSGKSVYKRSADRKQYNEIDDSHIYKNLNKHKSLLAEGYEKKSMAYKANLVYKSPKEPPSAILKGSTTSRIKITDSQLLPYPDWWKMHERRRMRKLRKNRRKGRGRYLPWPANWKGWKDSTVKSSEAEEGSCGVKKMTVDFADIGWGDWIIAPKSYDANYCAGKCPFPLTKKLRSSNHATIQAIVNAVGLYRNVPPPCCVPKRMSSLTLLYYDENKNVVLKTYPRMAVESCSCQ